MAAVKTILHITPFFAPNIGGVETHLTDLTNTLSSLKYRNIVLTYSPITTNGVSWKTAEKPNPYLYVRRFRWFGHNLFHRLESKPLLNIIYITPYLFIRSFIWLLLHRPKINTVHAHGINAAIIGIMLQKIFHYPQVVCSIYSSYDNVPLNSFSTRFMIFILNHCHIVLTQSDRSVLQLQKLGVKPQIIFRYQHWIDTNRFKPIKQVIKPFTVLFIGRLIPVKNAISLAKIAASFPKLKFVFVGTGPDLPKLVKLQKQTSNIVLAGNVAYSELHHSYQSASILCIPSLYDEGWGRVIMESISCGKPVIASNFGAIPEVVDSSVSILIKPTISNLKKAIQKYSTQSNLYSFAVKACRPYALKHFSSKNISLITKHY